MSDIYVPGLSSRFNTDKIVEDLMRIERIPRDRAEKSVEGLKTQKTYWQDLGRRITSLRESARMLYSFQNPFNERTVNSSNDAVLTGTATREALQQERSFTVKQLAQADRFLSSPLAEGYRVPEGRYVFTVGEEEVAFDFRGGTAGDFIDALNRRGRDKIKASLVSIKQGTRSLLVEALQTGAEKRLGFAEAAETLALDTGIAEKFTGSSRELDLDAGKFGGRSTLADGVIHAPPGGEAVIPMPKAPSATLLSLETATRLLPEDNLPEPEPPKGPTIPSPGAVAYGGVSVANAPSEAPPPAARAPVQQVDDMAVLSVVFADGRTAALSPLMDAEGFVPYKFNLGDLQASGEIVSLSLVNKNTHREILVRNAALLDPDAPGGLRPLNPVSTAQDAIVTMEGITVQRPTNRIDDLIPGVTLTARAASDKPVEIKVDTNTEAVKQSIIDMVGNYNRLMADINVLVRNDDRLIEELTYLSPDEREEMRTKMGAFVGDSTLSQIRSSLQSALTASYTTAAGRDLAMLAQIGIGTDVGRSGASGGYDPSRLRGYLEIDETALDSALHTRLAEVKQLFGNDTDGDLIADSGVSVAVEKLTKPFVETGGIITLKTNTLDARISRDERQIQTLDRQLASKEDSLRRQYSQMEGAYNRMESMSTSLSNFSQRRNGD